MVQLFCPLLDPQANVARLSESPCSAAPQSSQPGAHTEPPLPMSTPEHPACLAPNIIHRRPLPRPAASRGTAACPCTACPAALMRGTRAPSPLHIALPTLTMRNRRHSPGASPSRPPCLCRDQSVPHGRYCHQAWGWAGGRKGGGRCRVSMGLGQELELDSVGSVGCMGLRGLHGATWA